MEPFNPHSLQPIQSRPPRLRVQLRFPCVPTSKHMPASSASRHGQRPYSCYNCLFAWDPIPKRKVTWAMASGRTLAAFVCVSKDPISKEKPICIMASGRTPAAVVCSYQGFDFKRKPISSFVIPTFCPSQRSSSARCGRSGQLGSSCAPSCDRDHATQNQCFLGKGMPCFFSYQFFNRGHLHFHAFLLRNFSTVLFSCPRNPGTPPRPACCVSGCATSPV